MQKGLRSLEDYRNNGFAMLSPDDVCKRFYETIDAYARLSESDIYFVDPEILYETTSFAPNRFNELNDEIKRRIDNEVQCFDNSISYDDVKPLTDNLRFGEKRHLIVETDKGFFQFATAAYIGGKNNIERQNIRYEFLPKLPGAGRFEKGGFVKFGRYPQNNVDANDPIVWQVLDNDGKEALLISKYGLDCQPFHNERANVAWADCHLRKWLNECFLCKAFSDDEQRLIAGSVINTGDTQWQWRSYEGFTKGCGKTCDKIFCLSIDEAKQYYRNCEERVCEATGYAEQLGVAEDKLGYKETLRGVEVSLERSPFWLRSPGRRGFFSAIVDSYGCVSDHGCPVENTRIAVRPALRVKL